MRLLFAMGLYCGLRLGDAVLLKWSNIDLKRGIVMIVPQKTARQSNGKVVRIPLHPTLFSLLDQVPKEDRRGLVLPELGKLYMTRTGVAAVSKRVQKVFEPKKSS